VGGNAPVMPQTGHRHLGSAAASEASGVQRKAKRVLESLAKAGSGRPLAVPMSPQAKRELIERLLPSIEVCRSKRVPFRDIVEALRYQAGVDVCERTLRRVLDASVDVRSMKGPQT
jgi:hypothetical protein